MDGIVRTLYQASFCRICKLALWSPWAAPRTAGNGCHGVVMSCYIVVPHAAAADGSRCAGCANASCYALWDRETENRDMQCVLCRNVWHRVPYRSLELEPQFRRVVFLSAMRFCTGVSKRALRAFTNEALRRAHFVREKIGSGSRCRCPTRAEKYISLLQPRASNITRTPKPRTARLADACYGSQSTCLCGLDCCRDVVRKAWFLRPAEVCAYRHLAPGIAGFLRMAS